MAHYGAVSTARLATCDHRIQNVFGEVIKYVDCSILEGSRSDERQFLLYSTILPDGSRPTELDGINQRSDHQVTEDDPYSMAVDAAPYPIDWKDAFRFTLFAGLVLGVGLSQGVKLGWGGDWDGDFTNKDQNFHDMPHFWIIK